jgi:hypothetical protein
MIQIFAKSCFASIPGGVYRINPKNVYIFFNKICLFYLIGVTRLGILVMFLTLAFTSLYFYFGLVYLLFINFEQAASLLLSVKDLFSACFLASIGELSLVIPVVCYSNADTQKISIIKDNRGRSGVYR